MEEQKMVKIKDLEEKRCIMAYYKCHSDKNRKNVLPIRPALFAEGY